MDTNLQEQQIAELEATFGEKPAIAEEPAQAAEEVQEEQPQESTEEQPQEQPEVEAQEEGFTLKEDGTAVFDLSGEEQPAEPTEDVNALKEQIKALLEEKEKSQAVPKLDPRLEKMQRWIEQGNDVDRGFWELQSKSYAPDAAKDPKAAVSVLADKMLYIDRLESDEIDYYLKKNFPLTYSGDEDADPDELRDEQFKLRMEARKALPELQQLQEQVLLPQVDNGQSQEEYQKQVSLYRAESSAKLDEIESIDFELSAEHKLSFPFKGGAKQSVKSVVTEPENQMQYFQKRYVQEDGSVNYQKWARETFVLDNLDGILKSFFSYGGSVRAKEMLKELQGENAGAPLKAPKYKPKSAESVFATLGT